MIASYNPKIIWLKGTSCQKRFADLLTRIDYEPVEESSGRYDFHSTDWVIHNSDMSNVKGILAKHHAHQLIAHQPTQTLQLCQVTTRLQKQKELAEAENSTEHDLQEMALERKYRDYKPEFEPCLYKVGDLIALKLNKRDKLMTRWSRAQYRVIKVPSPRTVVVECIFSKKTYQVSVKQCKLCREEEEDMWFSPPVQPIEDMLDNAE